MMLDSHVGEQLTGFARSPATIFVCPAVRRYNSTEARRLTGGNMVAALIANAHGKFDATTGVLNESTPTGMLKLMLYSAHDTTVAALLSALDANHFGFNDSPP